MKKPDNQYTIVPSALKSKLEQPFLTKSNRHGPNATSRVGLTAFFVVRKVQI